MMSCGMIANETTSKQRSYDDDANNNKELYGIMEVVSSCFLLLLTSFEHLRTWFTDIETI